MSADLVQIVDSIASSPTVVLDLNDGDPWNTRVFQAPPPRLRRTVSSSMLVDGDHVSSSSYENRVLSLTFDLVESSQDDWATAFQALARVIDQERFWLKYQPSGASSPVFFRCWRADVEQIDDIVGAVAYRQPTISIVADPGAYGVPVDASFTITNDPTSGTNKMMYAFGTVKGDLETPLVLAQTSGPGITSGALDDTTYYAQYLASYALRSGTHSFLARDLTELTSGTDVGSTVTSAGSNYVGGNYKSCSFSTTSMSTRLSGSFSTALTPMPGLYRVLIRVVVASGLSSTPDYSFKLGIADGSSYTYGDTVTATIPRSVVDNGYLVDLGLVQIPTGTDPSAVGLNPAATSGIAPDFSIQAACPGGIALRFDEMYLLPVDTNYGSGRITLASSNFGVSSLNVIVYDGIGEARRGLYDSTGSSPFTGLPVSTKRLNYVGTLPTVRPGCNNYLQYLFEASDSAVGDTTAFTARYYPLYLYVRPATT